MGSVSQLHSSEMKDLLMNYIGTLNSMTAGEANEAGERGVCRACERAVRTVLIPC
jgi:hypothetical protein